MKSNDINEVMPLTVNEWLQEEAGSFPAPAKDQPDARVNKHQINARFIPVSQSIFEIKIQRAPIRPAQPHSQPQPQPVDPIMLLQAACVSTTTNL